MTDHPPNTQTPPDRPRTPDRQIFDTSTEPPTCQTILWNRISFKNRSKSMIRDTASPTPEAITIDDTQNPPSLNHAWLFKTLKDQLDDGIKTAMEAQFTILRNMFTQKIERKMNYRKQVLCNIQAETMLWVVDQMMLNNARLQRQLETLTREVRSKVAANAAPTCTPPIMSTPLPLTSYPKVAGAAAERQPPRQQTAGRPIP